MKIETTKIKYENVQSLKELIDKYNYSHRQSTRSCELEIGLNQVHKISVIDKPELIPYGIYDIGSQIGYKEMADNFRIRTTNWCKIVNQKIFENAKYPTDESFSIELKDNLKMTLPVKISAGINSNFRLIAKYLDKQSLNYITEQSKFKNLGNMFNTSNGMRINFCFRGNFLFLFGTDFKYSPSHYVIELDSIYEVIIPKDDF